MTGGAGEAPRVKNKQIVIEIEMCSLLVKANPIDFYGFHVSDGLCFRSGERLRLSHHESLKQQLQAALKRHEEKRQPFFLNGCYKMLINSSFINTVKFNSNQIIKKNK